MNEKQLTIGLIGAGFIVRSRHMPGLSRIPGVKVVAVCNRRRERAEAFAREFGVPRVVDDWREVVAMDDLDIIWIGTPPYLHCDISKAALAAGKHVFCQARMCMNLTEAREMLAAAQAGPDLVNAICLGPMGMPNDWVIRRMIHQTQAVGDIRHVVLREYNDFAADPNAPLHWRMDERISGLNVLSVGIWAEVLSRWVGPAARVKAHTRIHTPRRFDMERNREHTVKIPEEVMAVGDLACGGTFNYHWSGVVVGPPRSTVEILGTKGQLVYDTIADRLWTAGPADKELALVAVPPDQRRQWTVEADFIHAVRTGDSRASNRIEPDFAEGVGYMAFLQAVWDSADAGRAVDVPR